MIHERTMIHPPLPTRIRSCSILQQSYGLSAAQKTAHLLDHPSLGSNKPSVLMDQLVAFKPDSLDDII
jgi:hypothetical protein